MCQSPSREAAQLVGVSVDLTKDTNIHSLYHYPGQNKQMTSL